MSKRTRTLLYNVGLYTAVVVICICIIAPFAWLVLSSISTRAQLTQVPLRWLPEEPNFEHYRRVFLGGPGATSVHRNMRGGALNSFVVASISTLISLVAGSLAAYAFTRLRFRLKGPLLATLIVTQLLPSVAIITPMYIIMRTLNLLDTVWALILANITIILPLIIWILKGYFESLPEGLEEAARIDGCSRVGTLVRIILPLSAPGLAASGMFAFIIAWNEFFTAFILSSTMNSKTLSVIISEFSSKVGIDYVAMSTAGVLTSLPPVILALVFQRYIVQGLTAGAMKG
ncbi:MAG: carbohydrate ABC transporter permease [Firmicutes bacterium]|nr:carbohydrate ABC transporter permease [Bacillota bacterium]